MSRTFATLFSGGELFGVGAWQAGWRHVYGFEIDDSIASVARLNGFDVHTADVCAVDYTTLPAVDHLHASPSCKTASNANTNGGESALDLACADAVCRAIAAHRGRSFSLENVWPYRNYESFARILAALHTHGFVVDFRHVNSADYGVPQTRKRLILRAVRGGHVPPMHPTHRRGGDMFHAPWVGWYAAIEDLIPTLPPTTPAPWQMARLPAAGAHPRAFIIIDGGNTSHLTAREASEPSFTLAANEDKAPIRAYVGCRWVRLTIEPLGRLQTVPDWYRGLTSEINGNGVPCTLARHIMESLK